MLTGFSKLFRLSRARDNWDAPDHWANHHARRSRAQLEREAELRRQRLYRDAWMW